MGKKSNTGNVEVKPAVALIGTASGGKTGPPIGLLDVGVADGAYIFRVALPGEVSDLKFTIEQSGKVHISGAIKEGKLVKNSSKVLRTITREIPPPGPFTVSFNLPGPVDSRLIEPRSRPGGILEVVILKSKKSGVPPPTSNQ
ncbi:hypothetical protein MLD38_022153 [Melastoma candidum]|uniref:Uncharacterized protein n=1 Tax=Melastoma candidum TaxID=119954 RepID=A0ACB9QJC3_9MYRT|nr:hypothetical protein MLD38_022153 [Melastoma candidum]